jgi:hypothetical protein
LSTLGGFFENLKSIQILGYFSRVKSYDLSYDKKMDWATLWAIF